MEKILVTTDLSANSKTGIRFALQMAKQLDAELNFYYVSEVTKPTSWSDLHFKKYQKENIEENTTRLMNFVRDTIGDEKMVANVKYTIDLGLKPSDLILKAAKKYKADYICMSTRGAGRVKKLFGTNASSIITTSLIPVIVVPQRYQIKPIDSILFASDFAALDREMKKVTALAERLKATVDVFHYDYLLHVPENVKKLERKSEKYVSDDIQFHFKRLEIDIPLSEHLTKDVKKEKPSLVVLFTKQNRNWFDRLVLPSESAEMSFHLNIPLLTFRKKTT